MPKMEITMKAQWRGFLQGTFQVVDESQAHILVKQGYAKIIRTVPEPEHIPEPEHAPELAAQTPPGNTIRDNRMPETTSTRGRKTVREAIKSRKGST